MDLTYLNDFFDKIFVISLERSSDRREHISQVLKDVDYSIFWGVDGEKLDISSLEEQNIYSIEATKEASYKSGLTKGEIGCAWSHLQVYEEIIANNYERVLIFEDDVKIKPRFAVTSQKTFEEMPSNWDLIYLGYSDKNDSIPISNLLKIYFLYPVVNLFKNGNKYDRSKLRNHYPRNYSSNLLRAGHHHGTYAYGVSFKGAKKLVQNLYPICREADNAIGKLCTENKLQAFCLKQKLFMPDRSKASLIGKRHF